MHLSYKLKYFEDSVAPQGWIEKAISDLRKAFQRYCTIVGLQSSAQKDGAPEDADTDMEANDGAATAQGPPSSPQSSGSSGDEEEAGRRL